MARSLSIVIEWENAGRIGAERARRMLAALHCQLAALEDGLGAREVLIVCGGGEAVAEAERAVRAAAAEQGRPWPAEVRYLPVDTGDYYQQKNRGAAQASGDVLLFLDSDVVPAPGWLQAILRPFDDPAVAAVGGSVDVDVAGLYSKAMALGWFFTPAAEADPSRSPTFFANNVAFRREAFQPFPDTGQYRGQCLALAAALRESGKALTIQPAARVRHPPPEGASAFILRGLWNGHDVAIAARRAGRSPWIRGLGSIAKLFLERGARVWRRRSAVGLGAPDAAAAVAIVAAYHLLAAVGAIASALAPARTRRALRRWDRALAISPAPRSSAGAGGAPRAEGR